MVPRQGLKNFPKASPRDLTHITPIFMNYKNICNNSR